MKTPITFAPEKQEKTPSPFGLLPLYGEILWDET